MRFPKYSIIGLSLALAGTSLMCSIFNFTGTKPTEKDKQATIQSLQTTITAMEKEAIPPTPAPTEVVTFATMVRPPMGAITGKLSYPSEVIPPLRIVAVNVVTGELFSTEDYQGTVYGLQNVAAGTYHVIAYPVNPDTGTQDMAGGYTDFVLCGLMESCPSHKLIDVVVEADTVTADINPGDWYAPAGSFPPDPLQK